MGLFRKKKKKPKEEPIHDDLSGRVETNIAMKKLDVYTIPAVDEAIYSKENVKKQLLIRPTNYKCPNCTSRLYNTQLDGVHYYCPKCEKQYPHPQS